MFVVRIRVETPWDSRAQPEDSHRRGCLAGRPGKGCGMLEVMEGTEWIRQELGEHAGSFQARLGHRGLLLGWGRILRRQVKICVF